jgi:hypothetical protein
MSGATVTRARVAWGEAMPDWVLVLARECDRTSQKATGVRIGGYSPAVVNTVLSRTYRGNLDNVEREVRAGLMSATVTCPVIGEMSATACLDHQKAEWSPRRAMIQAACATGCPHSRAGGSK